MINNNIYWDSKTGHTILEHNGMKLKLVVAFEHICQNNVSSHMGKRILRIEDEDVMKDILPLLLHDLQPTATASNHLQYLKTQNIEAGRKLVFANTRLEENRAKVQQLTIQLREVSEELSILKKKNRFPKERNDIISGKANKHANKEQLTTCERVVAKLAKELEEYRSKENAAFKADMEAKMEADEARLELVKDFKDVDDIHELLILARQYEATEQYEKEKLVIDKLNAIHDRDENEQSGRFVRVALFIKDKFMSLIF